MGSVGLQTAGVVTATVVDTVATAAGIVAQPAALQANVSAQDDIADVQSLTGSSRSAETTSVTLSKQDEPAASAEDDTDGSSAANGSAVKDGNKSEPKTKAADTDASAAKDGNKVEPTTKAPSAAKSGNDAGGGESDSAGAASGAGSESGGSESGGSDSGGSGE